MTRSILILIGYYVVALVVLVAWTYVDHARTKRRADASGAGADRLAQRFAVRIGVLLGLLAGAGATLMLYLLLTPAVPVWVLAATGGGTLVAGFAVTEVILLRSWSGVDPLADLRGNPTSETAHEGPENGEEQP